MFNLTLDNIRNVTVFQEREFRQVQLDGSGSPYTIPAAVATRSAVPAVQMLTSSISNASFRAMYRCPKMMLKMLDHIISNRMICCNFDVGCADLVAEFF